MKKLQKGFTLIELMIVVAIIAILAAVAAPKFGAQLRKAQDAKGVEIVGTWRSALNIDYSDAGVYSTSFGGLTDNVDAGTIAKTYTDDATTTELASTGSTEAKGYVKVGTSTLANNPKAAQFDITGSTTEASINFASGNGKDTKLVDWTSY